MPRSEMQDLGPVAVEAHFDEQGTITPQSFMLHGRRHPVSDVGRRWTDGQGRLHFLVMTPPDRIFEIVFQPANLVWRVVRSPDRPRIV
ncbi:MAG: hypothetical protein GXP41_09435 [Chloroflexi bacterium]|nr:hypothetical protein [Chloroflexota bacterium]